MKPIPFLIALAVTVSSHALGAGPQMTYTFVNIITGPATDIAPETQQEAFAGHFSNMKRMAEAEDLLVAGPYANPKSWDDLRGMWIFATDDIETALEHAATDPPGKLGIFVFDAVQLRTDDALLELPRLEREDEARRLADPDVSDAWSGRGYFWASAPVDGNDEPDRVEGVALLATLIGREGSRIKEDRWLMLLDATSAEDARKVLTDAGCDPEDWTLDQWYGSAMPTKLPSLRE